MTHRRARLPLGTLSTLIFSFLVLGQETVKRPDTLAIPLDFEVNGRSTGEITVEADRSMQSIWIDGDGFKSRLTPLVTADIQSDLQTLESGFIPLAELQSRGYDIYLDLERLVVTLKIEGKKEEVVSERRHIKVGYIEPVTRENRHTSDASISAYANFNARLTQSKNELGKVSESHKVNIDHTINFGGFALEGDSSWSDSKGPRGNRFQLHRLRLVKDLPGSMRRFAIGDISTPIKDPQRGFQLWGASIVKDFDIQPYRTFTPTSSASFQLDESATVQMSMNGRSVKSLKLEPGLYDIEQFKLAAGLNTMELEIVTDSGTMERIQVNNYGEPTLLNKGVSTYALSIGYPFSSNPESSFSLVDTSWYQRNLSQDPIISGYYQLGLSDRVTGNLNLQSSPKWTRIGSQATWASNFGILNLNSGINALHTSGEQDLKFKLDWRRELWGFKYTASTSYATEGFETTNSDTPSALTSIRDSSTLRIDKQLSKKASVSFGFLRQSNYQNATETSAALNFGYKFPTFHTGLSFRVYERKAERGYSGFMTFTWNPRENWRTRTRYGFSTDKAEDGVTTNWDYSNRTLKNSLNGNFNLRSSASGKDLDGRFRIENDKYSATLSRAYLYNNIDDYKQRGVETSFNGEFAFAYADGAFGLTRRVSDSFAIVTNHRAWKDINLGINPTLNGYEQKSSTGFLKPVLADLRSYRESQAIIRPLQGDAFLEKEEFYFLPSYKRGIKLTIGNEFIYSFRSTLLYWNEQPVSYKTLKIIGEGMPEILTFTNRSGKFVVTGLKPGAYQVKVSGINEDAYFVITGDQKLAFEEQIVLSDPLASELQ